MSTPIEEPIFPHTLYLKDHNGRVYAIVRGGAGTEARGKWWTRTQPGKELANNDCTKVRHRETGEEGEVCAVETSTRMIRLGPSDDELTRQRWSSIDLYEVIGSSAVPLTDEQRKIKAARMRAELKELEAAEKADKAAAK